MKARISIILLTAIIALMGVCCLSACNTQEPLKDYIPYMIDVAIANRDVELLGMSRTNGYILLYNWSDEYTLRCESNAKLSLTATSSVGNVKAGDVVDGTIDIENKYYNLAFTAPYAGNHSDYDSYSVGYFCLSFVKGDKCAGYSIVEVFLNWHNYTCYRADIVSHESKIFDSLQPYSTVEQAFAQYK